MPNITSRVFKIPDVENFRDFYQYYRGQHRWLALMGVGEAYMPIKVQAASDSGNAIQVSKIENGEIREGVYSWAHIKTNGIFGAPLVGNHPCGKSYINLNRRAVRESSKGLALHQIEHRLIDPEGYGKTNLNAILGAPATRPSSISPIDMTSPQESIRVLNHIYNPVYDTFFTSLERMLNSEIFGAPINNLLGLHFYKNISDIRLVFMDTPIGSVSDDIDRLEITLDQSNNFMIHYLSKVLPQGTRIR